MIVECLGCEIELEASYLVESEREIHRQLREYERGDRESFDLTVSFPNTFFGTVWRTVSEIDYGETRTYGDVAEELRTAAIAVGNANANNPIPIIVPCHRLVGTTSLRGFRYPGLKERLLRHENEAGLERLDLELDGTI